MSNLCDHMYVQHALTLKSFGEESGMRPRDRPRSRTFRESQDPPDCQLLLDRLGTRDCLVVAGQAGAQKDSSSPRTASTSLFPPLPSNQRTKLIVFPRFSRCRQILFLSRSPPFSASRITS